MSPRRHLNSFIANAIPLQTEVLQPRVPAEVRSQHLASESAQQQAREWAPFVGFAFHGVAGRNFIHKASLRRSCSKLLRCCKRGAGSKWEREVSKRDGHMLTSSWIACLAFAPSFPISQWAKLRLSREACCFKHGAKACQQTARVHVRQRSPSVKQHWDLNALRAHVVVLKIKHFQRVVALQATCQNLLGSTRVSRVVRSMAVV